MSNTLTLQQQKAKYNASKCQSIWKTIVFLPELNRKRGHAKTLIPTSNIVLLRINGIVHQKLKKKILLTTTSMGAVVIVSKPDNHSEVSQRDRISFHGGPRRKT